MLQYPLIIPLLFSTTTLSSIAPLIFSNSRTLFLYLYLCLFFSLMTVIHS